MSSSHDYTAADLADFLADGGTVVAGGVAIGAGAAFVIASIATDLGLDISIRDWTETGAGCGAVCKQRRSAVCGAPKSRAWRA